MMKKNKGFKIIVFFTMFCLSVSYFSLLSPTTAYFYEQKSTDKKVNFDLFDVEQTILIEDENFDFLGSTKFADFNEMLFDKVVCKKTVAVNNVGEIPARVYVRLSDTIGEGLQYITFFDDETPEPDPAEISVKKGALKQKIETTLFEHNNAFVDGIIQENAIAILNDYNQTASYAVIQPGEECEITIVFWVEHDDVKDALTDTEEVATEGVPTEEVANVDYSTKVSVIATQDNDLAMS